LSDNCHQRLKMANQIHTKKKLNQQKSRLATKKPKCIWRPLPPSKPLFQSPSKNKSKTRSARTKLCQQHSKKQTKKTKKQSAQTFLVHQKKSQKINHNVSFNATKRKTTFCIFTKKFQKKHTKGQNNFQNNKIKTHKKKIKNTKKSKHNQKMFPKFK